MKKEERYNDQDVTNVEQSVQRLEWKIGDLRLSQPGSEQKEWRCWKALFWVALVLDKGGWAQISG